MPLSSSDSTRGASVGTYIRHAFLYHWNLLLFLGGSALALMSPRPDALLPIMGGLELAYLTGLLAIPRFRTAIDAKIAAKDRERGGPESATAQQSLQDMIDALPERSRLRFLTLRRRCFEMRDIATGVRGQAARDRDDSGDSIRTPALDRLLFLFLRLLVSQNGLDRFLRSTSESELAIRLGEVRKRLASVQAAATAAEAAPADATPEAQQIPRAARDDSSERMIRSLQDSVADHELRLDNYRKSMKDAEFVGIELDRIETKIQALIEMGVSSQDPDALSHQVTAAADSMQQTEAAVNRLQHLTGLAAEFEETPAILGANLERAVVRGR